MDTMSAFIMGRLNRGKESMVFDWHKAAQLIKDRKPRSAAAGLEGDWEYTGGEIYRDGKPIPQDETYTYLASTWATPQISIDGDLIDCFVMSSVSPGWGSRTYWPESALEMLK